MPQQTKTEALEELARLIRRDILNGEAPLNETWWFDDDTKMQDRIAHVLLDYSDEEKPTGPTLEEYNALTAALTEKCVALVVENKRLAEYASGNWVDVPPPSDAGCTYPECGPTCRRDCPPAPVVETPAVEERGPWVVYDPEREYMLPYRCVHKWVKPEELEDAVLFRDANSAQNCVHDLGIKRYRVITLAEARAIEAKR